MPTARAWGVINRKLVMLVIYGVLLGGAVLMGRIVPPGFVPAQDKDYLVSIVQLPSGASLERTDAVVRKLTEIALAEPGVDRVPAFPGLSVNGLTNSSSSALVFPVLKPSKERGKAESADAIAASLNAKFSAAIKEATIATFPPPPVSGMGALGGFKLQIEDRGALGYEALNEATSQVREARGARRPSSGRPSRASRSTRRSSTWTWTASRPSSSACR
jgi:multidrug efflux pump